MKGTIEPKGNPVACTFEEGGYEGEGKKDLDGNNIDSEFRVL